MIPIYQVDSFTRQPFHGNPAAVCLLDRAPPGRVDAAGGTRDEPVRDGVSAA